MSVHGGEECVGITPPRDEVGPTVSRAMIESGLFLKSLVKAAQHPVGMPIAMLDWAEQAGECVGIKNVIGLFYASIIDPEMVESTCA